MALGGVTNGSETLRGCIVWTDLYQEHRLQLNEFTPIIFANKRRCRYLLVKYLYIYILLNRFPQVL